MSASNTDTGFIQCLPHDPILLIEPEELPQPDTGKWIRDNLPTALVRSSQDFSHIHHHLPPALDMAARQLFKHLFNTTVSAYVLARRMEKGKELLEKGDTTVSEVAFKVGYANRAHFTRAFTRKFGYPPSLLLRQAEDRVHAASAPCFLNKTGAEQKALG